MLAIDFFSQPIPDLFSAPMSTWPQTVVPKGQALSLSRRPKMLATPSSSSMAMIGRAVHLRSVRTALPALLPVVDLEAASVDEEAMAEASAVAVASAGEEAMEEVLEVEVATEEVVVVAAAVAMVEAAMMPIPRPIHPIRSRTLRPQAAIQARPSMSAM